MSETEAQRPVEVSSSAATGAGRGEPSGAARTALPMDEIVRRSMDYCRRLTRRAARNFYYGMKLTPEPKRSALYAIYAFMRQGDDLADEPVHDANGDVDAAASVQRIEGFRARMQGVIDAPDDAPLPAGPTWPAFRHVVRAYPIDPEHLHAMLDGQVMDMTRRRYETFEQLAGYCHNVAGVVGLVCISVWGVRDRPTAGDLAAKRGLALQLTNILRDLVEDAQRGRVYLPADELERFGCPADMLTARQADPAFDELMAFQLDRARRHYEQSDSLEGYVEPSCRAASWAIKQVYRRLFDRIAADPRRVLRRRVTVSKPAKLAIALRAHRGWRA